MKKTLNIFGIILAWLLSIALVVMLIVTPIAFSALSLLNAKTITKVVADMFTSAIGEEDSQSSAESWELVTLSGVLQAEEPADNAGENVLEGLFGDKVSGEQMNAILSSKAAKEFIKAYTDDLANAFADGKQEAKFNAEKVKSIVKNNIDEIVEIVKTVIPERADMDAEELKSSIQAAVDEGAEQIVQALPKPEEIKNQIMEESPELETVLKIIAMKDTVKLAVIGVIVLISALIFVCRLSGMRGFRWLAVDLFVGGGFGAFVSMGLLVSASAVDEIAEQAGAQVAGVVGSLLSAFTTGMLIRTVVMLVFGGALLTAYIYIRKYRAQKLEAAEVQAEAEDAQ